jgi:predicted nucleic acid-binding protein
MSVEHRYYFDTNALLKYYNPWIKHYHEEEGILAIRRLVSNSPAPILVSPLTSLELIGKLTYFFRQKVLKRRNLHSITDHLKKDLGINTTIHPFEVVSMPEGVFRLAELILLKNAQFAISSNDALHLAIVQKLSLQYTPQMVTSDNSLQRVCDVMKITFYDPEIE